MFKPIIFRFWRPYEWGSKFSPILEKVEELEKSQKSLASELKYIVSFRHFDNTIWFSAMVEVGRYNSDPVLEIHTLWTAFMQGYGKHCSLFKLLSGNIRMFNQDFSCSGVELIAAKGILSKISMKIMKELDFHFSMQCHFLFSKYTEHV